VVLAAALFVGLTAPFLVSCWIAVGDPFHSINAVTPAYYGGDSVPKDASVLNMFRASFRPFQLLDTVFLGYTSYPFARKWHFEGFFPPLRPLLSTLALVGGPLLLLGMRGRILWLAWVPAMFPFVFTWRVPGGDAWRLTLFAYPFYLIAAGAALHGLVRLGGSSEARRAALAWLAGQPRVPWLAALVAVSATLAFLFFGVYYLTAGEAVRSGQTAVIATSPRDRLFFGRGFGAAEATPNMYVRRSQGGAAEIRLPLRLGFSHRLVLRLNPQSPDRSPPQTVRVALNGVVLRTITLAFDPDRFGAYELAVPATLVRERENRLELQARPDTGSEPEAGFVLWYLSVTALGPG
jgi:hypothetical protein